MPNLPPPPTPAWAPQVCAPRQQKAIPMGVSTNNGIPIWMVKIMEIPIKMDDLGVPLFLETPILCNIKTKTTYFQRFQKF